MRSVERRNFLKVAMALPFASPLTSFAELASPLGKPVFVAAGADATGTEHRGPRAGTHLDFKVLTKDSQAGFFLIEHRNLPQGGPVRHLHYAQEEWFYLIIRTGRSTFCREVREPQENEYACNIRQEIESRNLRVSSAKPRYEGKDNHRLPTASPFKVTVRLEIFPSFVGIQQQTVYSTASQGLDSARPAPTSERRLR